MLEEVGLETSPSRSATWCFQDHWGTPSPLFA